MIQRFIYTLSLLLAFLFETSAQSMTVTDEAISKKYPFIHSIFNRITNNNGLDSFYQQLSDIKKERTGVVSIVHIGDSHIQADFLTGVVRTGLQDFFGNAGRGLVFPYHLAQANSPDDVRASSSVNWQFSRISKPDMVQRSGLSGYSLRTNNNIASLSISLKINGAVNAEGFNKITLFADSNSWNSWMLKPEETGETYLLKTGGDADYPSVTLEENTSGISLYSLPSNKEKDFFGVSFENSHPGILYHSIGVNGARYDQFNIAPLFWQQLPALKADLYIISLGTNEAQAIVFNETAVLKEITIFLDKLREASPKAAILITTAPDSFKSRGRSNTVLKKFNQSLTKYCDKNHIPYWDLYRITNGYGSSGSWARKGLMNKDKIHFTASGYQVQGNLLLNALAKGYNGYISNY